MVKTLQNTIDARKSGNYDGIIKIIDKKLSDEIIFFPLRFTKKNFWQRSAILYRSCFRNSELHNIRLIGINLDESYFKNCLIHDCIFEMTCFESARFEGCVFKNCYFTKCNMHDINVENTTFDNCGFFEAGICNSLFESCHFIKPVFTDSAFASTLIDSKFSNSKKLIEFEGETDSVYIFDQIDKLYLDEE